VEESDESAIRNAFNIPQGAIKVSYSSNPKTAGTFGREGLKIHMEFQLPTGNLEGFVQKLESSNEWGQLPIPAGIIKRITNQNYGDFIAQLGSSSKGYFACKSAGDNLMHAKLAHVEENGKKLNDFMLCIINTQTGSIHAMASTDY